MIDHGRVDEGLRTLAKLHSNGDVNDPWTRAEFDQIQDALTYEHEHEAKSYVELFANRSCFRRLFLACSIQASVQMTGVSAIQYYSPDIFAQIGIPGSKTLQYQGISSILALVAQFCCILFIDWTGRRWAMIGGNLANCVCFIIATILLARFPPGVADNTSASWGFIVITWLYNISFSFTNGPLSCRITLTAPLSDAPALYANSANRDRPCRDLRHAHPLKGRLHRHNDLLRLQHHDRPSLAHRAQRHRLALLHPLRTSPFIPIPTHTH